MVSDKSIFKAVLGSDPLVTDSTLSRLLCEARESKSPDRDPEQTRVFRQRESQRRVWGLAVSSSTTLSPDTVEQVFPAMPPVGTRKRSIRQTQPKALQRPKRTKRDHHANTSSSHLRVTVQADMGLFGWLPGELRNQIYRDVVVSASFTRVACNEAVCGRGACEHTRFSIVIPIACTCRQIRHEVMPIFCSENTFQFDEAMVRNRCVANWLASIDAYIRVMHQLILQLKMESWGWVDVTVSWRSGRVAICYDDAVPRKWISESELDDLLAGLNMRPGRLQSKVLDIVASDELSDLAWCCWRRSS